MLYHYRCVRSEPRERLRRNTESRQPFSCVYFSCAYLKKFADHQYWIGERGLEHLNESIILEIYRVMPKAIAPKQFNL